MAGLDNLRYDEAAADVAEGREAARVSASLVDVVAELEENVIQVMIARYKQESLTPNFLAGSVGELSALRGLLEHLDHTARTGFRAAEEIDHG